MTTGTKEWAEKNINIFLGCEHNCRYCYAREMAVRYGRCTVADWPKMKVNQAAVDKDYRQVKEQNLDGENWPPTVMFPSSHDITPSILSECLCVLNKLLDAGNQVLIVSKPHWPCISLICERFEDYKKQLEFRFTIGSVDDEVLKFWECNAPNFEERLSCLVYAHKKGYKTSVSVEPFLDAYPQYVYEACREYLTESIWFGLLNQFNRRVLLSDVTQEQMEKYVEPLRKLQSPVFIKELYRLLGGKPFVKWKDSIRKIVLTSNTKGR